MSEEAELPPEAADIHVDAGKGTLSLTHTFMFRVSAFHVLTDVLRLVFQKTAKRGQ